MSDSRYHYNPSTGEFTFSTVSLARLIYRCSTPKEKLEAEDAKENAKRIERSRRKP
jgi:hypothetical protein